MAFENGLSWETIFSITPSCASLGILCCPFFATTSILTLLPLARNCSALPSLCPMSCGETFQPNVTSLSTASGLAVFCLLAALVFSNTAFLGVIRHTGWGSAWGSTSTKKNDWRSRLPKTCFRRTSRWTAPVSSTRVMNLAVISSSRLWRPSFLAGGGVDVDWELLLGEMLELDNGAAAGAGRLYVRSWTTASRAHGFDTAKVVARLCRNNRLSMLEETMLCCGRKKKRKLFELQRRSGVTIQFFLEKLPQLHIPFVLNLASSPTHMLLLSLLLCLACHIHFTKGNLEGLFIYTMDVATDPHLIIL